MERNQLERDVFEPSARPSEASSRSPESGMPRRGLGSSAPVEPAAEPRDDGRGDSHTELLKGIHLQVRAELGRTKVQLKDALKLEAGSVVDLHKLADDPIDLYVGDLLVARGEVLVLNDTFCIRVTEVFSRTGEEES